MKLMELEQQLGISFPKKFHEIYETGAMKWLEMNSEQIQKNRMIISKIRKRFSCSTATVNSILSMKFQKQWTL